MAPTAETVVEEQQLLLLASSGASDKAPIGIGTASSAERAADADAPVAEHGDAMLPELPCEIGVLAVLSCRRQPQAAVVELRPCGTAAGELLCCIRLAALDRCTVFASELCPVPLAAPGSGLEMAVGVVDRLLLTEELALAHPLL